MRKLLFYIVIFILCSFSSKSQENLPLFQRDSIVVSLDENQGVFYTHDLQKGETIFRLAKTFGVNHKNIMILNGISEDEIIPLHTLIKIPLNTDYLLKGRKASSKHDIPVYYKVKRKETLFKIAHVYFNQKIEDLVVRNSIKKLSLSIDQLLLVGWIPIHSEEVESSFINNNDVASLTQKLDSLAQMSAINETSDHTSEINDSLTNEYSTLVDSTTTHNIEDIAIDSLVDENIISLSGIAIWERDDENTETLLALHKNARIGSVIKLQNPVTKKITIAQVVGHIPENVYTNDVDIIISKAVAQQLGALDTRFQIWMTYYE